MTDTQYRASFFLDFADYFVKVFTPWGVEIIFGPIARSAGAQVLTLAFGSRFEVLGSQLG